MNTLRRNACLLAAAILPFLAGCASTEITSVWHRDAAHSAATFGDRRIAGRVTNDDEYLYVEIRTNNRDLSRLMFREGVTLWFDGAGGSKKSFGIRYPLRGRMSGSEEVPPQLDREERVQPTQELELFSGEKEHQRMSILATGGIDAGVHREVDTVVFTFRVPLAPGAVHPFGIGVKPGAPIGLGVVTSSLQESPDLPVDRPEGEGEPEGGFGGRRSGGVGGRGRGAGRPEAGDRTEQLSLWLKIHLATSAP